MYTIGMPITKTNWLQSYSQQKFYAILARAFDSFASDSGGVRMYCLYASLRHLPNICIRVSSIPAALALVAAPIRKL